MLIAFRAETICAERVQVRLLCFAATISWLAIPAPCLFNVGFFSYHLISSHRSFSWKLMEMVHCILFIVTAACVTPSHLMSCRVFSAFFTSFHLISCFPSFSQLFSACTNNSQYDFVLQSLHKALPRTTLHYKTCKKVLPSTTLHCFTKYRQGSKR